MITLARPFPEPYHRAYAWREGDRITHLDGREVEDILDVYYYVPEDADRMTLHVARADGSGVDVVLTPASLDTIRAAFAPLEFKRCACDCVFCFVDQNPRGMRNAIYVKDEDYRFSFLYGNYITLTSLGRKGLERVIEQRMSPLYVSVHATDIEVRTRMLGIKRRIDVVQMLRALVDNGIEVHTQVVLCPGWNDGAVLEKTFRDLLALARPPESFGAEGGVGSLAIVPVGLTAHREGLTRLRPVTPSIAADLVARVAAWQEEARAAAGNAFVHLSDEFYLLAQEPFPAPATYADFPQVDNGIGLTVQLRETWREDLGAALARGERPTVPVTVLTGELAARAFQRELAPVLQGEDLPPLEIVAVANRFYGTSVTVAGLLSGGDLRRALLALPAVPRRTVALSPRAFNSDGLTLDDMTLADLQRDSPHRVLLPPEEGFVDFWSSLT